MPSNAFTRQRSAEAAAEFHARITALGGVVLGEYRNSRTGIHVRCPAGHDCYPVRDRLRRGDGICPTCRGGSHGEIAAAAAFRARLAELGAELLEPEWLGNRSKHRAICAEGHGCYPTPSGVRRGQGICRTCADRDPITAAAAFYARVAELGGTVLGEYSSAHVKVRTLCAAGHECYPIPQTVRKGGGICRTCSRCDPAAAEAGFRALLAELGATLLEPRWLGSDEPHRVRCAAGHECAPKPNKVVNCGRGICRTCSGRDPVAAEAAFLATLGERGATPLYEEWRGVNAPHHIRCRQGHDSFPAPAHVQQGTGICRVCARRDPATAEAEFRERLAKVGAVPLYERWLGALQPHHVRCAAGHDCYPRPASISQGFGPCRTCKGQRWDVFYVVASPLEVKFGITSGDPAGRLRVHVRNGFTRVIRIVETLPGGIALDVERAVKAALALADERPIRGKEYFDISCLALILDVADSWLTEPARAERDGEVVAVWLQDELFAA